MGLSGSPFSELKDRDDTFLSELYAAKEMSLVSSTKFGRYWLTGGPFAFSPLDCMPFLMMVSSHSLGLSARVCWSVFLVLSLHLTQKQFILVLSKSFDNLFNKKIYCCSWILFAALKGWTCSTFWYCGLGWDEILWGQSFPYWKPEEKILCVREVGKYAALNVMKVMLLAFFIDHCKSKCSQVIFSYQTHISYKCNSRLRWSERWSDLHWLP